MTDKQAAKELREWIASVWDVHLERAGLQHSKPLDRKQTIEQLAQVFEAHADGLLRRRGLR